MRRQQCQERIGEILIERGLPIPELTLPPTPESFQEISNQQEEMIHYYHDDWSNVVVYNSEDFMQLAHKLGFTSQFRVYYEVPTNELKFFQIDDAEEKINASFDDRDSMMEVTHYLAFHPEFPNAWMMYIWYNEYEYEDLHQFHLHCNKSISETAENITDDFQWITKISLPSTNDANVAPQLINYSNQYLQKGLTELWGLDFYASYRSNTPS